MDFQYTSEQEMTRKMVREFTEKAIIPKAQEIDEKDEFPFDIYRAMADLNLFDLEVSQELGGPGMDSICGVISIEELARGSVAVANMCSSARQHLFILEKFGSPEQQKALMPRIARGELIGSFALTEPDAGSDASRVQTKAVPDGDSYVINGSKMFITMAPVADFCIVIAVTDREKATKGMSAILVDLKQPGVTVGKPERKLGHHGQPTAEIHFDDVRVPRSNLIGREGEGYKIALSSLDGARLCAGAIATGAMVAAYEASVRYAKQRVQFGKPIAEFQAIQWMLVDMAVDIEVSRLLLYRAAAIKDTGARYTREAAMAKLYATDAAMKNTTNAIQIHGGYGYMKDYPVERYFRDVKLTQIYDGTNEIQRLVISRYVLADN
ncbi:MAG: acyl-CoA dehydrogenase family protein [Firmicutes bacterium]|jgi:alkylation response protein AidB-like acyl-CoA dehydrogenase|nr:acyl-CoA dehydrogenase family protein [Bacillota bacterium]MDH7496751.1 acyl-CoA dehydrogenase family protein [Bacillota bacterium]